MKKKLLNATKGNNTLKVLFLAVIMAIFSPQVSDNNLYAASPANSEEHSISWLLQNSVVTLDVVNQSLIDILKEIHSQVKFEYIFQKDVKVDRNTKYSLNVVNTSLRGTLDKLFANSQYAYSYDNQRVIITNAPVTTLSTLEQKPIEIKGKVLDEDGKPVLGATIISTSGAGTITDDKGLFALTLPQAEEIEVSCVGYLPEIIEIVKSNVKMTIELKNDNLAVDDVIVTGMFKRSRESNTGAVTTVREKDLKMFKGQNLLQTLANIDPAFNIAEDNFNGSDPNRKYEITIRGKSSLPSNLNDLNSSYGADLNTPLVILDGFEISMTRLMDFNDEDIESITILKDASSTAMYGSRGANGVIVVKTKDPVAGKLRVSIRAGLNLDIPDLSSYNLMNAAEKLELERYIGLYDSDKPAKDLELKQAYGRLLTESLRGETEWIREPVRVGIGRSLKGGIEGGSKEFRWGVSLSNNVITGSMKGSDRSTTSASITLNYSYKNLIFRNVSSLNLTKGDEGSYGSFSTYASLNPYYRAKDEFGNYNAYFTDLSGSYVANPLNDASLNIINTNNSTTLTNNFSIDWNIIKNLTLRGQLGLTKGFNNSDYYLPANHSTFLNEKDDFKKGSYSYATGESMAIDGSLNLSYSTVIKKKHSVYVGIDTSIRQNDSRSYSFNVTGFVNPEFSDFGSALDYTEGSHPYGTDAIDSSVGLAGNLNYSYDQRYFFDASYRLDGSSQFGANNRFAPFWSVGAGWNMHNENFMKNQSLIDELRIRFNTGETGSQQFSRNAAKSMYGFSSEQMYLFWTGALLSGIANPDLTWQTTTQHNLGLDARILNGKINIGFDAFYKQTNGLVSSIALDKANGFPNYSANTGSTANYGFEATLGCSLIRDLKREIIWNVTGRISNVKNEILELSDGLKEQVAESLENNPYGNLMYEGQSQSSLYAVPSLGIDPVSGKELFYDKDGNITKEWNGNARIYCGVEEPTFKGSISSMLQVKDFSLNFSFAYHWGGVQYNETLLSKVEIPTSSMVKNVDKRVFEDRWLYPGDVKPFKGIDSDATYSSTRFVMNDRAFELQSVSLQYDWNTPFVKETIGAETINASVNMSNLFYLASIKRERGTSYPFANTINLNLSITF